MRVRVVGLGAIGSRVAIQALKSGHQVVGVDTSAARLRALSSGHGDAFDRTFAKSLGSDLVISNHLDHGAFDATIIAVPTWSADGGLQADVVCDVVGALAPYVRKGEVISLESSLAPGSAAGVVRTAFERYSALRLGEDVHLVVCPERIDVTMTRRLSDLPRVLGGITPACATAGQHLYQSMGHSVVAVSSTTAAEATKLLENSFRLVNIAFINEVAEVYARLGLDMDEVIDAAATKPFGFLPFRPGLGAGGHCIPVAGRTVSDLAEACGLAAPTVAAANASTDASPGRVLRSLHEAGVQPASGPVLILGAGYKNFVEETTESPALRLANALHDYGYDVVVAHSTADAARSIVDIDAIRGKSFAATLVAAWSPTFEMAASLIRTGTVFDYSGHARLLTEHSAITA